MSKFLDFILYPKRFYRNLTYKTKYLVWGILLVGLIDIILFSIGKKLFLHFTDHSAGDILLNLFILGSSVAIIGFLDVFFVSLPLSDLFYKFSEDKDNLKKKLCRILFMKVYICSHFIVAPVSAFVGVIFKDLTPADSNGLILLYVLIEYAIIFWSTSILTRGSKILYGYTKKHNAIIFAVLFIWNRVVISKILHFIINAGVFKILQ